MKLDLQATESTAALVLAAFVADQVAHNLGIEMTVHSLSDTTLTVHPSDVDGQLLEVVRVHLSRALGEGFSVDAAEAGMLVVSLVLVDDDEKEGEEEGGAGDMAQAPPKRKRGRPRKNLVSEPKPETPEA